MFENAGEKIKTLAKVLFWIEAIVFVIGGIVMMSVFHDWVSWVGIGVIVFGIIFAWITSMFLYGFGELITDTKRIADSGGIPSANDSDKRDTLEALRRDGLITEEEYQQKLNDM